MRELKEVIESQENGPKFEDWGQFLQSNKAEILRKKVRKYDSKYRMFHELPAEAPKLEGKFILESVNSII